MSGKRQLVLYVDGDYVEIAKARGINLSQFFNDTLKSLLEIPEEVKNDSLKLQELIKEEQTTVATLQQQLKSKQIEVEKLKNEQQKQFEKEREGWH